MIVAVAGEREWAGKSQVFEELDFLLQEHVMAYVATHPGLTAGEVLRAFVLRHGASGNVDTWANEWGLDRGVSIERFPAQWRDPVTGAYQPWAGPKRNKEMATKEPQPDLWLAFWSGVFQKRGGKLVSGTYDGIVSALGAGVRVRIEPPRRK